MEERILKRIKKTKTCWLWTGEVSSGGYGRLIVNGKRTPAHRYVYEFMIGKISEGLHLDHLCRIRNCVNPMHLEPVTPDINILRGISPPAKNARKTHCKHGHEFTGDNLYMQWNKKTQKYWRKCRACDLNRWREIYYRDK